jgi:hypothetical protein
MNKLWCSDSQYLWFGRRVTRFSTKNTNGDRDFLSPYQRTSSTFLRFPRLSRPVLLSANSTSDTANDSHVAPNGAVVRKFLIRSTTALATFSLVGAVFS